MGLAEAAEAAKNNLRFWWTAWVELAVILILAGGTVWAGSTSNITSQQWTDMSWWDRHKLFMMVFLSVINSLKAFLSNTMATLKAKQEANGKNGKPEVILTARIDSGTKPP